jgi:hypothetical protein
MAKEDSKSITLEAGEGVSDNWTWNVGSNADAGTYKAKIVSEDDEDTVLIDVLDSTKIDDFERSSVDVGGIYTNGIDAGNFEITTNNPVSGTRALRVTDGSSSSIYSLPGDGASAYPKRGDIIKGATYFVSGTFSYFFWAIPDNPGINSSNGTIDGYSFYVSPGSSTTAALRKRTGGNMTTLDDTSASIPGGEYTYWNVYHYEGTGANGNDELKVELYDDEARTNLLATLGRVEDSEYNIDGGFGYRTDTTGIQFDNIRKTTI